MIESILEILNNCKIKSIETSLLISDFPEFPNKHLIIPSLNDLASKLLPTTLLFLLSNHHRSLYWIDRRCRWRRNLLTSIRFVSNMRARMRASKRPILLFVFRVFCDVATSAPAAWGTVMSSREGASYFGQMSFGHDRKIDARWFVVD